jgi:hypothetical protein
MKDRLKSEKWDRDVSDGGTFERYTEADEKRDRFKKDLENLKTYGWTFNPYFQQKGDKEDR